MKACWILHEPRTPEDVCSAPAVFLSSSRLHSQTRRLDGMEALGNGRESKCGQRCGHGQEVTQKQGQCLKVLGALLALLALSPNISCNVAVDGHLFGPFENFGFHVAETGAF